MSSVGCHHTQLDMCGGIFKKRRREVRTDPLNQQSFNLNDLSDGLYGIALQTNGSMVWNGRVVIIH